MPSTCACPVKGRTTPCSLLVSAIDCLRNLGAVTDERMDVEPWGCTSSIAHANNLVVWFVVRGEDVGEQKLLCWGRRPVHVYVIRGSSYSCSNISHRTPPYDMLAV